MARGVPGPLPGPGGRPVAVQDLRLVLVPRGRRPVRVQDQGPAPAGGSRPGGGRSTAGRSPSRTSCRRWPCAWCGAPRTPTAGWLQPPAHWQCRSRRVTALRIPAGIDSAYPMSSGRLGPPSRTPSCRRRRNDASPPGPDSRSTALPMTACSSAAQAAVVSGAGGARAVRRRPRGGAGPVPRTAGPGPPARPRSRRRSRSGPSPRRTRSPRRRPRPARRRRSRRSRTRTPRRAAHRARTCAVHCSCSAESPSSSSRSASEMCTQALTGCPARSGSRSAGDQPPHASAVFLRHA